MNRHDALLQTLNIQPAADAPLYQQVYDRLRTAILTRQIETGTRLPSTRALSEALGVSRNTVLNAYDQLRAEGYIVGVEGSGTVVASLLPEHLLTVGQAASHPPQTRTGSLSNRQPPRISRRAWVTMESPSMPARISGGTARAFGAGQPALDAFPFELWNRCVIRRARYTAPDLYSYQAAAGYRPLREAVAGHLGVARGVRCTPEQVIIVAGSQGALDLSARVLLDPGDGAWMEDPGYLGARGALVGAGARVIAVPVDSEGLNVAAGIARCRDARLAYVTPSHQFPMAVTMSLSRRLALLDWAARAEAWILEDDYNSEYRYLKRPLAALQGLDTAHRVIYIGTFSKVMFPALRLGYIVVPEVLIDAFHAARRYIDVHPATLEQAALADFIDAGHFTRHIRRMRTLYGERRELLVELARAHLPLDIHAPEAGMHLVGWLTEGIDDREVSNRAAAFEVFAPPVSHFSIQPLRRGGLVMGYAAVPEAEIKAGVERLARALVTPS